MTCWRRGALSLFLVMAMGVRRFRTPCIACIDKRGARGQSLAEGINAIRFTIENDGAGDPESVFAEIDVFGTLVDLYSGPIVTEHGPYGEVGGFTNEQVTALHPVGIDDVLELPTTTGSLTSGAMKFGGLEENINDGLAVDA